jgi:hypothetical protein
MFGVSGPRRVISRGLVGPGEPLSGPGRRGVDRDRFDRAILKPRCSLSRAAVSSLVAKTSSGGFENFSTTLLFAVAERM